MTKDLNISCEALQAYCAGNLALLLFILASLPAMSYPTQAVPIRQVIGSYGFPEHTLVLADTLHVVYVDAPRARTRSSSFTG
ncbi:hypothetical protein [Hymenobacter sp. B1770]|uniref:hypothetical protein n=1 Tax=Hymenobacter sp. B1770 TaxID=1718788 RepID=UPI003CF0B757